MSTEGEFGAAALQFVDLLTPGNFARASQWLAPECEYRYGEEFLRGEAIIRSFEENHEHASKKLDRIEYQQASVEKVEGRTVWVRVTDRIWAGERTHDYHDRLIIMFAPGEVRPGLGSVVRIENRRVDGERDKLLRFLAECGVQWG